MSITRDTIILTALRKIGLVEPADTINNVDYSILFNASINLNLMVKQWMIEGIKLWSVSEINFPLTANKTTYTIGPSGPDVFNNKPLRVMQAFIRNTTATPNIDIPVQLLSRQEYNTLGSKYSTGTTNSIFLDVGNTTSTLNVYLTPDTLSASTYVMYLTVQRPLGEMNSGTDSPDFPDEWMNALVWGLADDLSVEYDVHPMKRQEIQTRARQYKETLEGWDVEHTSVFFTPGNRQTYSKYL
jgi:hypothetical protein